MVATGLAELLSSESRDIGDRLYQLARLTLCQRRLFLDCNSVQFVLIANTMAVTRRDQGWDPEITYIPMLGSLPFQYG